MNVALGIDIGGSGVKGAPVNLETGEFLKPRLRIPTPKDSTPENVAAVVKQIVKHFEGDIGDGPIGITIPAPVVHGTVKFMANLDQSWVGLEANKFFTEELGHPTTLVNDADAAGLAEVKFGAAGGHPGLVIMTTLGTGIGTALINRGVLVPNTELGHLEINGHDAEKRAASSVKNNEGLSYEKWAKRLTKYYRTIEMLFSPDLIIVGGGVSSNWKKFGHLIKIDTEIIPAVLRNQAGIIGAAMSAVDALEHPEAH